MRTASTRTNRTFSRFDAIVFGLVILLTVVIGLLIWRGDQVGIVVVERSPASDVNQVPVTANFMLEFDEVIAAGQDELFSITPDVAGRLIWSGNQMRFEPEAALEPGITYHINVQAGLLGAEGSTLNETISWSFRTATPGVIYQAWDEQDAFQLFRVDVESGTISSLPTHDLGIDSYDISADGLRIVYSAVLPEGGRDLYLMRFDGGNRSGS